MLLPTLSLPTFGIAGNIGLLLIAVAILATVYGMTQGEGSSDFAGFDYPKIAMGLLALAVMLLGIEVVPSMLSGAGSFTIPNFTMPELLAIIVSTTIPLAAYQVIQLTRVIKWSDVVVFIGLALIPSAAILGLLSHLSGAAVTGLAGIMTAHALGIIDTD